MVKALAIVALVLSLAGCATSPTFLGLPCTVGPFTPDKGASTRWTRGEQEQLRTLNTTGERICDWKPPN